MNSSQSMGPSFQQHHIQSVCEQIIFPLCNTMRKTYYMCALLPCVFTCENHRHATQTLVHHFPIEPWKMPQVKIRSAQVVKVVKWHHSEPITGSQGLLFWKLPHVKLSQQTLFACLPQEKNSWQNCCKLKLKQFFASFAFVYISQKWCVQVQASRVHVNLLDK